MRRIDLYFLHENAFLRLSGGTADEEPLVNGAVNLLGGKLLVGGQRRQLVRRNAGRRLLDSDVGAGWWSV
jgi:hypothetical protein